MIVCACTCVQECVSVCEPMQLYVSVYSVSESFVICVNAFACEQTGMSG